MLSLVVRIKCVWVTKKIQDVIFYKIYLLNLPSVFSRVLLNSCVIANEKKCSEAILEYKLDGFFPFCLLRKTPRNDENTGYYCNLTNKAN